MNRIIGGIEAGGTKFVCAVANESAEIIAETRFPTTTPDATLGQAVQFFSTSQIKHGPLSSLGIASFGPIDCRPESPEFGRITTTPKPGWAQIDLVGKLREHLPVPIAFDTDVNGAALAESQWGAAIGLTTCLYITVGTGIGGGFVMNGKSLQGLLHPEMGHIQVAVHAQDPFPGNCPYHTNCLEGLASGLAMEQRWKATADQLPLDHLAWAIEADYLAQAVSQWILTLSPEKIILGGGVMHQEHLFPMIRRRVKERLNSYVQSPLILNEDPTYIVPPQLGDRAGILGALALALPLIAIPSSEH